MYVLKNNNPQFKMVNHTVIIRCLVHVLLRMLGKSGSRYLTERIGLPQIYALVFYGFELRTEMSTLKMFVK